MPHFFQHLLRFLLRLGYFGPLVMGTMDSSFLFLPLGNDLLVVLMVARNHSAWLIYVLSAVCGSTLGVFLLDVVARRIGEAGVQKVTGPRRFAYLKRKIDQNGGIAIALACLAPPPFPFTMLVATTSALAYSRRKLLLIVAGCRAIRFVIFALLALRYGRAILRLVNSPAFKWTMIVFSIVCIVGSVFSILTWVRSSRRSPPIQTVS